MPVQLKRDASEYVYANIGVKLTSSANSSEYSMSNVGLWLTRSKDSSDYVYMYAIEYILNIAKFWDGNAWVSGLIYNGSEWKSPKYWTGNRWSD